MVSGKISKMFHEFSRSFALIALYRQRLPLYRGVARTGDNWPRKLSQKKKKQTRQKIMPYLFHCFLRFTLQRQNKAQRKFSLLPFYFRRAVIFCQRFSEIGEAKAVVLTILLGS